MNLIGGSDSFRYFKIISVNNKKVKDEGRYKTKASPGDAAKKAFTQLSKKYKTNKLTFSIKETTQGSNKKEHGPYLGEKIKLKKPLEVKYKGKNKPVIIKYQTKIHLVKDYKQKGGIPQKLQITRHGQSCSNIMTLIYALINYDQNPFALYGDTLGPSPFMRPDMWYQLGKISQDPPVHNGGLCDLMNLRIQKAEEGPIEEPNTLYCSSMCRAIQTAMMLYPNGGSNNTEIIICPWSHEIPSAKGGFAGVVEESLSAKSRAPRHFIELQELTANLTLAFQIIPNSIRTLRQQKLSNNKLSTNTKELDIKINENLNTLMNIFGNQHIVEKIISHNITANLKLHHTLYPTHHIQEVDINRFMHEVINPDNNEYTVIISHGYTMRAGFQTESHQGWAKLLKENPDLSGIDPICFKKSYYNAEKQNRRAEERMSPQNCIENDYIKLLVSGDNVHNAGYITIMTQGPVRDKLFFNNEHLQDSIEKKLKKTLEYHFDDTNWIGRPDERLKFFYSMNTFFRNLIFTWGFFAVGNRSYCKTQREILNEWTWTNREILDDMNREYKNNWSNYLTKTEQNMFKPLMIPEPEPEQEPEPGVNQNNISGEIALEGTNRIGPASNVYMNKNVADNYEFVNDFKLSEVNNNFQLVNYKRD